MSRYLKNTLMIIVIFVLLLCSFLTIYNEINLSKNDSFEMNQSYLDPSPKDIPNNFNFNNIQPTQQNDDISINDFQSSSENNSMRQYGRDNRGYQNFGPSIKSHRSISVASIIILFFNSVGIALTTMYLIVSKFNKGSYKKTFENPNNMIIFSTCSIGITMFLVIFEVIITNVLL